MSHWRYLGLIVAFIAVLAFALGSGCEGKTAAQTAAAEVPTFDSQRAWNDLVSQVKFGPRVPGTELHETVKKWLAAQLAATGVTVTLQPFSNKLGGKTLAMTNIIAEIPGTGAKPREKVLLCAHWDTRPIADHDPKLENRKKPIDGASDGASGVAVLLEIARQLRAHPIDRDVIIAFFDGEDYGPDVTNMLLGSAYYAKHLPDPKPNWGVLLDMVGDKNLDIYREPYSEEHAKAVNDRLFSAAQKLALMKTDKYPGFVDSPYQYTIEDDHVALNEAGVPTADLIDFNYPPWHTLGDTTDKCSPESLRIVGLTVLYAISH